MAGVTTERWPAFKNACQVNWASQGHNTHQQYKGPRQHAHLNTELNQGTGSSCYTRGSQGLMLMMLAFPRHGNSCAHTKLKAPECVLYTSVSAAVSRALKERTLTSFPFQSTLLQLFNLDRGHLVMWSQCICMWDEAVSSCASIPEWLQYQGFVSW